MNDYAQTGFQSACSEFSQNSLSLDEFFNLGFSHRKLVKVAIKIPHFEINRGDFLMIDLEKQPRNGDVVFVYSSNRSGVYRFEYQKGKSVLWPGPIFLNEEEFSLGVVVLIIKEFVVQHELQSLRNDTSYLDNKRKQDSLIKWNNIKKYNQT